LWITGEKISFAIATNTVRKGQSPFQKFFLFRPGITPGAHGDQTGVIDYFSGVVAVIGGIKLGYRRAVNG
jgi:hypothetical protein